MKNYLMLMLFAGAMFTACTSTQTESDQADSLEMESMDDMSDTMMMESDTLTTDTMVIDSI